MRLTEPNADAPDCSHGASELARHELHPATRAATRSDPEAGIEARNEGIMLRFARLDVMPGDAARTAAGQERHAGQLGAIVGKACL